MKAKVQIQLTEVQLEWLDYEATRKGESRSAIVRNAINAVMPPRLARHPENALDCRPGRICEVTHGKE